MIRMVGYALFIVVIIAGVYGVYELTKQNSPERQHDVVETGLKIDDVTIGMGKEAHTGDILVVHYKGTLENGIEFDSSYAREEPFSFTLGAGQVIRGWDIGLEEMKVGGVRRLVIPPDLAYGDSGAGSVIPPNATLLFEVSLLEIR